jgi:hypothetical protein
VSADTGVALPHWLRCDIVPVWQGKSFGVEDPASWRLFGEIDATEKQLMETGQAFFCALYGQQQGTAMSEARYHMYTGSQGSY